MAQVKKISVATVYGKLKLSELIEKRILPVMDVIGIAVGTKSGISSYGDWECLEGSFKATNPETGEITQAAVLFLPDVALTPIKVALSQGHSVEFGIRVLAKYVADNEGHKSGGSPYEYTFESLISMGSDDPIARLEAKIAAQAPALAAPAETPAPAAKPAKGSK